MARAMERVLAGRTGGFELARVTVDFLRPVPLDPLTVTVEVVRAGQRACWLRASVVAGGEAVAHATALGLAPRAVAVQTPPGAPLRPLPEACPVLEFPFFPDMPAYHRAMDTRLVSGRLGDGAAAAWFRMRVPLVAGETPSPAQRVLVVADSGSGVGLALDHARHTSINADLTVVLHRPPRGEWIGLDARTVLEERGTGLTRSRLHDLEGPVGAGAQALVVAPRERNP